MEPLQAVILGIIQGLTEFLPVSSSGHLVIFQRLFGLTEPALFFDASVHVGTLAAVIVVFQKEIRTLIISSIRFAILFAKKKYGLDSIYKDHDVKFVLLIMVASIPTGIMGLLFHQKADQLFSSVAIVGGMLIATGFVLWSTRWVKLESKSMDNFSIKDALIIGVVQGIAIIPGISRSGSTIAAGLFLGLSRKTAARFSFLMSIPAILGAEVLSLLNLSVQPGFTLKVTIIGTVVSCITGYCALKMLIYIVNKGRLYLFAPYCWVAGSLALILIF